MFLTKIKPNQILQHQPMSSLVIQPHKRGIVIALLKNKNTVTFDVTFFLEPTFFSKNSLQGQNIDKENFWELLLLSLPPEQPSNLLPNPTISPKQLLNQPSYPPEQPDHLLNQLVFETNKPKTTEPNRPWGVNNKNRFKARRDSLQ